MADDEESTVEERLEALEAQTKSSFPAWIRDGITLLSPIALALIGYMFQQTLQEARNDIQRNELDIRRVDSAQRIMSALFEENYEEARALQALFDALLADSAYRASLGASIDEYFQTKFERVARQTNLDREDIMALRRTAEEAAGFETGGVDSPDLDTSLHVVLVSLIRDRPDKFARLIPLAEAITADPNVPDAEIWCSETGIGFLALTVGSHPLERAWEVGENVHAQGWDESKGLSATFYLTRGDHLYRKVWPGDHDPKTDPCE